MGCLQTFWRTFRHPHVKQSFIPVLTLLHTQVFPPNSHKDCRIAANHCTDDVCEFDQRQHLLYLLGKHWQIKCLLKVFLVYSSCCPRPFSVLASREQAPYLQDGVTSAVLSVSMNVAQTVFLFCSISPTRTHTQLIDLFVSGNVVGERGTCCLDTAATTTSMRTGFVRLPVLLHHELRTIGDGVMWLTPQDRDRMVGEFELKADETYHLLANRRAGSCFVWSSDSSVQRIN